MHRHPWISGWEEGGKFKHARIFLHHSVNKSKLHCISSQFRPVVRAEGLVQLVVVFVVIPALFSLRGIRHVHRHHPLRIVHYCTFTLRCCETAFLLLLFIFSVVVINVRLECLDLLLVLSLHCHTLTGGTLDTSPSVVAVRS